METENVPVPETTPEVETPVTPTEETPKTE